MRPVRRFIVATCLALAVLPTSVATSASPTPTPERLFSLVSPGMVKILTPCKHGVYLGSGFLVGPRTIVTARHVLVPPEAGVCTKSAVKQEGTNNGALVDDYDSYKDDDLAVAHLTAPITGFYFGVAPHPPRLGTRIIGLGYSLGNPLSFNQGTIALLADENGVPSIGMNLLGAGGSSGGPIVDLAGQVIGLTQRGIASNTFGAILSIDLATIAPSGRALCQDVATKSPTTLCGSLKPSVPGAAQATTTARPNVARLQPPTLETGTVTAKAYNAHTIDVKARHIPSPTMASGKSVEVPQWNGYLRLALIANQDPYGKRYASTYVRCWSSTAFDTAAAGGPTRQVFRTIAGPLGFYSKGSSWIDVSASSCVNAAKAARGELTQTTVVALGSILHETFNRQGIKDEGDLACLGAIGVWEAVNRRIGSGPAARAWTLLLDWYASHLGAADLKGLAGCTARFSTDWNG